MTVLTTPAKRSKVHPIPASRPENAALCSSNPGLQLMDNSQSIRTSASIHKYHGSCHATLDGLNIYDGTGFNYQESKVSLLPADEKHPAAVFEKDAEDLDQNNAAQGSRLRLRRVPTVVKEKAIQNMIREIKLQGNGDRVSSVLLTSLEVDEMQMTQLCEGIAENGGVRCLDLHGQMISQFEGYQLGGALFSSPKLATASFRSCVSRNDVLRCVGSNLGFSKSLTSIDLSNGFVPIEESGSRLLAVGLRRNRSVTDINLSCNNLGTDGLLNVVAALTGHNRMKRLNVAGNSIPPEGGTWLAQVSSSAPALILTIIATAITIPSPHSHRHSPRVILTSLQFLDKTHSMEVLDVSHNLLDLPALIAVMCAGKPPRGLEKPGFFDDPLLFENVSMLVHVDASYNPIHVIEPRLGWAVGRARRLISLNLSNCMITTGIHEFAVGLNGDGAGFLASTSLQCLNLASNQLKDDAVLPRWRRLVKSSWLDRLKQHPSLVQIDMRGNNMGNDAALSIIQAIYTLQNQANKRGRGATGRLPSCELICDDNFFCIELQRAVFFGSSNDVKDSNFWLREFHRQCNEVKWIARKKAVRDFVVESISNAKAFSHYLWESKPSLWLRFQTVKLFTGEPPSWWVVAQEAQKRKTMQLEKLVKMMADQEEAALAQQGLTRDENGRVIKQQTNPNEVFDGGID